MNTLVLLLLTASVPGQSGTVISSQPTPVIQSQSGPISSYESDDSGWMGRFRNRQGLFSRLRGWFNRGQSFDQFPSTGTSYPSTSTTSYPSGVPVSTSNSRLVPTPVTGSQSYSTTYGYGLTPYQYNQAGTVNSQSPPK